MEQEEKSEQCLSEAIVTSKGALPGKTENVVIRSSNSRKRKRIDSVCDASSKQTHSQFKSQSYSSTRIANTVMKKRLGGSVSDPLNLQGLAETDKCDHDECSTSTSSADNHTSHIPKHLLRDPLNLEGKGGRVFTA